MHNPQLLLLLKLSIRITACIFIQVLAISSRHRHTFPVATVNTLQQLLSHILYLAAHFLDEEFPARHLFDFKAIFVRVFFDGLDRFDEVRKVLCEDGKGRFEVRACGCQFGRGTAASGGGGGGEGADPQVGVEEGAGGVELGEDVAGWVRLARVWMDIMEGGLRLYLEEGVFVIDGEHHLADAEGL
jgi:hypothetical protein